MDPLAFSASFLGVDGYVVRVEATSAAGTPSLAIIGLRNRALSETRDRVRCASENSGYAYPPGRLLVNLSPADINKDGSAFDLAIALALLAIEKHVDSLALQRFVAIGELALDGSLRPVAGILPLVLAARTAGFGNVIVPAGNAEEAALIGRMQIYPAASLKDAVAIIAGTSPTVPRYTPRPTVAAESDEALYGDFSEIQGHAIAKRAFEIAAAGGHNLLVMGPSGCGKTMLARRLPSILPPLTANEALEVTKIYSVAGLLGAAPAIAHARPFRFPHFSISQTAFCGGNNPVRPGELSLADHGVLYMDELPEFSRAALEALRQPLEDGVITVARAHGTFTYPAHFTLVGSMHPCPCGYRGTRNTECHCDDPAIAKYLCKLPGPLLDRLDLQVELHRVPFDEMAKRGQAERSSAIRARVIAARRRQEQRFAGTAIACNAKIPANSTRAYGRLEPFAQALLEETKSRYHLTWRALDSSLRVARTIADLAFSDTIAVQHLSEALEYRALERAFRALTHA